MQKINKNNHKFNIYSTFHTKYRKINKKARNSTNIPDFAKNIENQQKIKNSTYIPYFSQNTENQQQKPKVQHIFQILPKIPNNQK